MEELNLLKERVSILENKLETLMSLINKPDQVYNENLSIIIEKYKKSLVVKNMYSEKNTTVPYKEFFKKLGAKWTKNDNITGWLFVGVCKEDGKKINEYSKFIIDEIEKLNIEYEVKFEE